MENQPVAPEDLAAINAFKAGDAAAFEPLFLRYRQRIYAQAYRMLRDEGLALDVVQETFIAFLHKLPSFEPRAPVIAWLSETAWRLAQTQRRRRLPAGDEMDAAGPRDPGEGLLRVEEAKRLWEMVGTLSERDRQAVLLRYGQGLDNDAVADQMGITVKAVTSHLARAMGMLREKMQRSA